MWLLLDPRSEDGKIKIGAWGERGRPRFFVYDRNKEISLLGFIDRKTERQKDKKTVKGIVVIPGPGTFSTVRSVAVLANSFAFTAKTPLVSMKPKKKESSEAIFERGIELIKSKKQTDFIEPLYGKEPNITFPS